MFIRIIVLLLIMAHRQDIVTLLILLYQRVEQQPHPLPESRTYSGLRK